MKKLPSFLFLLLLPLFFFLSTSSPNPDSQALQSFKTSTLSSSNSLSSWSNSTHLCSTWIGVTCNSKTNRVNRLVLENLNLTGSIQALTQLTHLRLLSLKYNNLTSKALDFSNLKSLKLLYLSHNGFSGNFPVGITELRHLHRIDLSYNQFSGEIPLTRLTQLPKLLTVHLESNSFTGLLQSSSQVDSFKSIVEFNVSQNNLSGEIPKPLSFFKASCFTGNKNLCGKPLMNKCLNQSIQNDPMPVVIIGNNAKKKKFSRKSILVILLMDFVIVAIIGIAIFFCCRRMKQRSGIKKTDLQLKKKGVDENVKDERDDEVVFFEGSKRFKVNELLKSSAEMLGKGSVGTTYKVIMDNGAIVVVKRAKEKRRKKEIEGLLKEIGGLRNSHIVSLRAYYCSKDELLLVYDFLPNGSLHHLLHGNRGPGRTPLNWTTRLKFALDIAEGLVFLHNTSKSKLSHGHLTSLNIVINQQGNACISDVALHQLFLIAAPTNNAYTAPELLLTSRNSRKSSESRKFSEKSDVYSFGVILLEILTGRLPESGGETDLVKWVQSVSREQGTYEVFDFELLRYKEMEKEMVSLFHVALLCLVLVPRDRPKISIIHKMIKDIIKGRELEE